ncbi:MAG: sugar ABC transporter ATP-binding protein [Lachnospiraceae bacterium]|nr:sugar ABC transporter ATP-binding protein [Lachnospiraceae bacterium]
MPNQNEIILEMKEIEKGFPGVKALDHARLCLKKGEVHALIGENGAGKSTLMKILLGIYHQDSGTVIYKGQEVDFKAPHDALTAGISMIHQEISLIPTVSVAENIWIGREKNYTRAGIINTKKRNQEAQELLDKLGIRIDAKQIVRELSVANMQLVEIARAVSYHSDVIIMDEPTSSLSDAEIEILYRIIREVSANGTSIIFISHKLEEIFEVCDRVTVMRDGQYISDHDTKEITQPELVTKIAGREIKDLFPKQESQFGEVALEVKGLCSGKTFQDVSFSVRKGEILGFCGLVGAGRTEIMRAVFGIDKFESGEIYVEGKQVHIHSPKDAIANGLAMVTEDRRGSGIISGLSVKYNMSLAYLSSLCNGLTFINKQKENSDAKEMSDRLAIHAASLDQAIGSLSGGNQQKAIVARWLLSGPKILILDEPTRGIDVGSKSEIHRLISELAVQGLAVIMISSEMPEILGMSDRVMVVRDGRLVGEFNRDEADQETLIQRAFGA